MEKLKNLIAVSAIIAITCSVKTDSAIAKSVYAITEHHISKLKAYKITGDQLAYQADVNVTNYATGAVGLAIDSNLHRPLLLWRLSMLGNQPAFR